MAKNPAFLFYTADFLVGTMFMSNEQVGIYIKLLCIQHQHIRIDKTLFDSLVNDGDTIVRNKFTEDKKGYYNPRLEEEIEKRNEFCESRRANRTGKKNTSKTYVPHMEDEDEDIYKELLLYWNNTKLKRIKLLSKTRKEKIRIRMKDAGFRENWKAAIDALARSSFCQGKNDRGWCADIGWLIDNDTNYIKALEGKYDDKKRNRFASY